MRFALFTMVARVEPLLERIAAAYRLRAPALAAAWTPVYPDATAKEIRVISSLAELTDDDCPVGAVRTLDAPGDLAYHTQADGHPYGLVLADDFQTLEGITIAFLHELFEAHVDPMVDRYLKRIAAEVQDPLQDRRHDVDLGSGDLVPCCASVTPAWFALGSGRTTTDGSELAALTTAPGGYFQRDDGTQAFGVRHVEPAHKWHHHSRPSRRRRARARATLHVRGHEESLS